MIQARQECLLNEEKDVINRGVDNANKLLAWYNDRLKSLEKRSELLKKGMVLLVGFILNESSENQCDI